MKKLPPKKQSTQAQDSIRMVVTGAHSEYAPGLSRRALYKTNNVEVSQDMVQTTFLKTLLYLQRGGKIDTMRSFLNRILNDLVVDEYRKRKVISLDYLLDKGLELTSDEHQRIIDTIDGRGVVLLIPLLPLKYQRVMHLRYLQDLTLKEISLITGQSPNTVAVQAHRGLVKLRSLYYEACQVNQV